MQAHLTGASYMDKRGVTTDLYLAALAPTGMGKEEPRVTNKRLAAEVGILGSVPDAIASGEGLEDALSATPSLLLQNDEADALLGAMRGSNSRAAKLNEKVVKLAIHHAISVNAETPVMTGESVAWAVNLATHVTKQMLYEAQFHVAEGKFDALVKGFLGLLAKHGGSLDRRSLLRGLHVDHITFHRIVMTLHMSDDIIEESECGKSVIYTLKSAA